MQNGPVFNAPSHCIPGFRRAIELGVKVCHNLPGNRLAVDRIWIPVIALQSQEACVPLGVDAVVIVVFGPGHPI